MFNLLLQFAKIIKDAERLKYLGEIKMLLGTLLNEPDEDFVRYFAKQTARKVQFTSHFRAEFTPIVKEALAQFIDERVDEQIERARKVEPPKLEEPPTGSPGMNEIVPLPEEVEGFNIVRAICCQAADVTSITMSSKKTYCAILLDNSIYKQICRLYLKSPTTKYVVLRDKGDDERVDIETVVDLFKLTPRLLVRMNNLRNKGNDQAL